jgi:hypothetical protein
LLDDSRNAASVAAFRHLYNLLSLAAASSTAADAAGTAISVAAENAAVSTPAEKKKDPENAVAAVGTASIISAETAAVSTPAEKKKDPKNRRTVAAGSHIPAAACVTRCLAICCS